MNLTDTIKYLKEHNFVPSKKMGQNFLINDDISKKIVNKINWDSYDCIVEIGPGLGALTQHLVKMEKPIIAIELDKRLSEYISKFYPQVKLINNDVLNVSWDELLKGYNKVVLISNLPYSISSVLLGQFIKNKHFTNAWFMLQQEMVNRVMGSPGSKQYNGFTAFAQFYTNVKKLFNISKQNFYPIPQVDSVVIELHKLNKQYDYEFEKFLKLIFSARRKTIINNLKAKYASVILLQSFQHFSLDKNVRAETLNPNTLYSLFQYLLKSN